SSCEAEIYAGARAAQELCWLTYLLTDLGEAPRSPPVLYVNNKAMLALCQEHGQEHRTKHISLRYVLARELQQRGQLCLAYVASQANTADVFTNALQPCDHQPCFVFLDWSCDLLVSPTLSMGFNSFLSRYSHTSCTLWTSAQLSRGAVCTKRSGCTAHLASLSRILHVRSGASAGQSTVYARCLASGRTTLAALGFAPSTANPSLFLHIDTSLPPFYVLMYVDDLVFTTAETKAMTLVKSELQKRQTYTDLDELRNYLRLQITQDRARGTITLNLSHMVHQVLQGFGFTYSSPQSTPLPTGHSLSAPPSDESLEPSGPYPELVGYLMYLMTCTRPDLAYPLAILARYVAHGTHKKEQLDAAKRVLRYLCSTSGMGPVLGGRAPVVLIGHADASWNPNH
ncbi:unnamed protein product, partial [Closterium sp. NIES-53]